MELNKSYVIVLLIFLFPVIIKIINTVVCQTCSTLLQKRCEKIVQVETV